MRVAVLGAGGTIAPAIVRDLAESEEVAALLCSTSTRRRAERGRDRSTAGARREALRGRRARPRPRRGTRPRRVRRARQLGQLPGQPRRDERLPGGGLPLPGPRRALPDDRPPARARAASSSSAGLLALLGHRLGAGQDQPDGASAAVPASSTATRPMSIHVSAAAGRDLDPPAGFSVPYALQTLLDELTLRPVVLRDGDAARRSSRWPPAAWSSSATRSARPRRSTPCTPSFAPSATASAAARRASGSRCRRISSTPPRADGGARGGDRRSGRDAVPPSRKTVSVHLVEASGGGRHGARPGASPSRTSAGASGAASCPPPRRPRPRCGCSPGADQGPRRAAARGAASSPTEMFAELETGGVRTRSRSTDHAEEVRAR